MVSSTITWCVTQQWLLCSAPNNDLVDGDENELDEKANEAHHHEASRCSDANLVKLLSIGLGASIDKPDAVLGKLFQGRHNRVHLGCDLLNSKPW